MLPIHKNTSDPLRQHRSQANATYDNIPTADRQSLVSSLLREQKYICAYCMCRINEETMSVEHWQARTTHSDMQIAYGNLLAVCCGNEGKCEDKQHCDTKKGNFRLNYNPSDPSHHSRLKIKYAKNGEISSADQDFGAQLSAVLNLNLEDLKERRKNVFNLLCRTLNTLPPNAPKTSIQRILDYWKTPNSEHELPPFAGVAIYFLEKRLAKAQ